ncbi:MAG: hypothetical protein ACTSRG_19170 [Candidatus Helarchaeota archaeon]
MQREKLATASASGILGIISGIWYIVAGMLFVGFGETFTKDLAPLLSSGGFAVLAGILSFSFAALEIIGGIFVYNFKYKLGGFLILIASIVGILAGGGFYVATLWGSGAGVIALICPNLEAKIALQPDD